MVKILFAATVKNVEPKKKEKYQPLMPSPGDEGQGGVTQRPQKCTNKVLSHLITAGTQAVIVMQKTFYQGGCQAHGLQQAPVWNLVIICI